jgi:hypothetical protein
VEFLEAKKSVHNAQFTLLHCKTVLSIGMKWLNQGTFEENSAVLGKYVEVSKCEPILQVLIVPVMPLCILACAVVKRP